MYKTFPFSRYKEKQVSLLVASWKDSIFGSQKNPIKSKALFPQWNLKICQFYDVSNTEAQFDFPRKIIPAAHRFLEDSLVTAPDYYHNHIFKKKNFDKRKMLSTSFKFSKKDASCNWADTKQNCILLPFPSDFFCVSLLLIKTMYG